MWPCVVTDRPSLRKTLQQKLEVRVTAVAAEKIGSLANSQYDGRGVDRRGDKRRFFYATRELDHKGEVRPISLFNY